MGKRPHIEILARGVHLQAGQVLLCRTLGDTNTYLPGGHVDFAESARCALAREIEEEMGRSARVGRFLGIVEHQFMQRGRLHGEVNLLFEMQVEGLSVAHDPPSAERHLGFCWAPLEALSAARLEPAVLCRSLQQWLTTDDGVRRDLVTPGAFS